MTLHSPIENSLAVLNPKILEANSHVQNVELGGHQTCLSINLLWHELCEMLRRLVGTPAPGHHVQFRNEKVNNHGSIPRSPLTVTLWPSSFLKKYGPMIPPAHKAHQTWTLSQVTVCGNKIADGLAREGNHKDSTNGDCLTFSEIDSRVRQENKKPVLLGSATVRTVGCVCLGKDLQWMADISSYSPKNPEDKSESSITQQLSTATGRPMSEFIVDRRL
ncbi:uncharacterized protein TNCV_221461 [Trichonephila clavipes]|nr:uncharacterized protein TNCV_221461 [Trichonephila clavipes]